MFVNELLKDKLCFKQENQQQYIDKTSNPNDEQSDFTFNYYIPKVNIKDQQQQEDSQQPSSLAVFNNPETNSQAEQQQERNYESSQLQMLKTHILTIQSIALKQIEGLKRQLQQEVKQKQMLQQQLQKIKSSYENDERKLENEKIVNLLKEENNMLKSALKKQLQINKNLIKNSITASTITNHHRQNKKHQHTTFQQTNQQNDPLLINSSKNCDNDSKDKPIIFTLDRPLIPHPGLNKKSLRI